MKIRKTKHKDKIELQMTPMIDIVFQLLVFFIMTFKIVEPEGDFNVRMPPPASQSPSQPPETPTLILKMTADADGNLASMKLGDVPFTGTDKLTPFDQLRSHIVSLVGDEAGPGTASEREVELDSDFNLKYRYDINAITAISGYIQDGQKFKLIEKIRFAPSSE
ncbi:biopolymer transporter ExbD [Aeoliella sp. ICT_H6.2]|uniref:Biopolymer transporter ExbD n=1 Tax=Aeoliella straminimaris TaxID=2954799 RepID=A0A9X2FBN6_9BACT|nr:biopolymer transporter ExbD [Aeoliella straminimaris]MCO6045549.1 biopolymer transporter ExbD [Aeoliella straminimaris]